MMEQYPNHFDGSMHPDFSNAGEELIESFQVTDEMRKSISANPYAAVTE